MKYEYFISIKVIHEDGNVTFSHLHYLSEYKFNSSNAVETALDDIKQNYSDATCLMLVSYVLYRCIKIR